ncbi:hypothetical protein I350_00920 [Cryptococcus amylolentus CBS 6273]|uniref:Uncharacterized protein n=1 Tax=Cryptococcus amylolentus CBS 6273 TaxID=1296118 RepID=A0A1E3KGB3_9TREE|nr:hypothetical protein I350_00920 [Cryptococcus amylolentus CBS 6273]
MQIQIQTQTASPSTPSTTPAQERMVGIRRLGRSTGNMPIEGIIQFGEPEAVRRYSSLLEKMEKLEECHAEESEAWFELEDGSDDETKQDSVVGAELSAWEELGGEDAR